MVYLNRKNKKRVNADIEPRAIRVYIFVALNSL